jgi:hypothetical protein
MLNELLDLTPDSSWGVQWSSFLDRGDNLKCPNCDWKFYYLDGSNSIEYKYETVVGFDLHGPLSKANLNTVVGVLIVECQKCQKKYWYHVGESTAKLFKLRCPQWPKKK